MTSLAVLIGIIHVGIFFDTHKHIQNVGTQTPTPGMLDHSDIPRNESEYAQHALHVKFKRLLLLHRYYYTEYT